MKKIIVFLFGVLFLANSVFAVSLQTSTSIPVLYVQVYHNNKWSGWSDKATVSKGDKLWFHIHAYANGGDIKNLVSSIDNLDGRSFSKGDLVTVNAFVDADNAPRLRGSVQIYFADDVKLTYSNYRWATKLKGPNPEANEHPKRVPYGQTGREVLTNLGVRLGNLAQDHRSNFLLSYSTGSYHKAIAGKCGDRKNSCISGSFADIRDDQSFYKWSCKGVYGGQTDYCSLKKEPVNAECSTRLNKCFRGWFSDLKDNEKEYLWKCNGYNGGQNQVCRKNKTPINGVCGKKNNTCVRGRFKDLKDTYEKKIWQCQGLYGGVDVNCEIQKYCPCKLDKVVGKTEKTSTLIGPSPIKTDEIKQNIQQINQDNSCMKWKIENQNLANENEKLKLSLGKIGKASCVENKVIQNNVFCKTWYWVLFIFYSIILASISYIFGRK